MAAAPRIKGPIMKQARLRVDRWRIIAPVLVLMMIFIGGSAVAQDDASSSSSSSSAPAPPSNLIATDHPMDGGDKIDLQWELSPDDPIGKAEGEGLENF